MNITLRQAHKLIDKINSRLATLQISATQAVNIWEIEDPTATYTKLSEQFAELCQRNRLLVSARQCIRNQIRVANYTAIDGVIADRKEAMDAAGFIRHQLNTVNDNAVASPTALERKVAAEREAAKTTTTRYGANDMVTICLYSQADVETLNDQLNKQQLEIERLEDQLSKLNSSTEIDLVSDVVKTLQSEGLM